MLDAGVVLRGESECFVGNRGREHSAVHSGILLDAYIFSLTWTAAEGGFGLDSADVLRSFPGTPAGAPNHVFSLAVRTSSVWLLLCQ